MLPPPAEKLQNFFGVFLQFQIGVDTGHCAVYGNVSGDVRLTGSTVIISGEEIYNDTLDTLVISGQNRSVIRHPARDELAPQIPEPQQEKKQRKEVER